jgi:hypothetical protein
MQGCVPEIQAMGNSTLGLAQTPEAPELSGQHVKKTGNGGIALRGHRNLRPLETIVGAGLPAMAV